MMWEDTVTGSCENGYESLVATKQAEFPDYLYRY
jgi:hypothetical protein